MRIYSKPFIPYYSLKKKQGTFGVVAEKQQKTKYKKKNCCPSSPKLCIATLTTKLSYGVEGIEWQ